jgi:hypothetical protein
MAPRRRHAWHMHLLHALIAAHTAQMLPETELSPRPAERGSLPMDQEAVWARQQLYFMGTCGSSLRWQHVSFAGAIAQGRGRCRG